MKIMVKTATFFFVFFLSVSFCFPQDYQSVTAVRFKDGSIVQGKIMEVGPDTIRIQRPDGVVETRRYQDVASFIQGPYSGQQPPPLPSAPPPAVASPPPPAAPPPAYALPPPRRYATYYRAPASYVALKAGVYTPESDQLSHFDSGFNGELAFGHYFHRNFAMEFSVGYFETWSDRRDRYYGSHDNRNWVVPVTISLRPTLPLYPFEFYGLLGGGLYIIGIERERYSAATGYSSFSDSSAVLGGHLGAGFNWNIDPRFAVGVEAKYLWAEKTFEKTINSTFIRADADVQGLQTTINIMFRF